MSNFNYTPFQLAFREKVAARPTFSNFVEVLGAEHEIRQPGPCMCLWYEGQELHACRLGQKRILREEFFA